MVECWSSDRGVAGSSLTGITVLCPCADPGVFARGSRPDCQKTALTLLFLFFVLFSPQLILLFYRGGPMVISKKTLIFQGLRGSPKFSRGGGGVQLFPGGVQMLISIETHITWDVKNEIKKKKQGKS